MTASPFAALLALLLAPAALGGTLDELGALPGAGSTEWDRGVAFHLLIAFDANRSGRLDRRREVDAIPCEVWRLLDRSIAHEGRYPGLLMTYGFRRDLDYVGHAIGVHRRLRGRSEAAMRACGVVDEGPLAGDDPAAGVLQHVISSLPGGDGKLRDHMLGLALVVSRDVDRSGALDTVAEIEGVPCSAWRAIDDVLGRSGEGMIARYGLREDLAWRGDALQIPASMREPLIAAMGACGIRERRSGGGAP